MKTNKGFSLVEMVIVLALIGIAASISSFAWQRYVSNANLRTAAREMATDIGLMKQRAVSNIGTTYTIDFDKAANTYTLKSATGGVATVLASKSLAPPEHSSGNSHISDLPGGGTAYTLTFLARGTLSPSVGTIVLENSRGSTSSIIFNITGKTYVTFAMQ